MTDTKGGHTPEDELERLRALNAEMLAALEAIESICAAEILARFGGHPNKTADELGRGSGIYSLLVVPRNMARAAIAKATPQHAQEKSHG